MIYMLILGFLASLAIAGSFVLALCRAAAKACPAPPGFDERGPYDNCGEVYDPVDDFPVWD